MTDTDILLTPFPLGNITLASRMVMEPVVSGLANDDGSVSQRLKDFIMARAINRPGLIILEAAYVHPTGKGYVRQLGIDHDGLLPDLTDLVSAVHNAGVPIFAQLMHTGRYALAEALKAQPVAPSAIPPRIPRDPPRELSREEIAELVQSFAAAARRARKAGFAGVEIQAGSGYLVSSFLSPYANRRTDQYGGSLENRARFLLEIIDAVRQAVGPDYPVTCRFNGDEVMEEGNTYEEVVRIGQRVIEHGITTMNLLMGWHESQKPVVTMDVPPDHWLPLAARLRETWQVPVIMAYGLHTPALARQALTGGVCDLVGWARPMIADPELPRKIRENREEEIRPCVSCCAGCFGRVFRGHSLTCSVNPWAGRESEYRPEKTSRAKKVLIAGGGPAGMQAAITAARRGHQVKLLEQASRLGGQLVLAAIPPHRQRWLAFLNYLEKELQRAGVEVRTGMPVTEETFRTETPDVFIRAVGAIPSRLDLPGLDRWPVYTAVEVLQMPELPPGESWLVIGGGLIGLETAEFLAVRGKEVTVLEKEKSLAKDATAFDRAGLIRRVKEQARIYPLVSEIRAEWPSLTAVQGDTPITISPDAIAIAAGMEPNPALSELMLGEVPEAFATGDCLRVTDILNAVHQGAEVGNLV